MRGGRRARVHFPFLVTLVLSLMMIVSLPLHSAFSESGGPTIIFTLEKMNIPTDTALPLNATVLDPNGVDTVTLHWSFSSSVVHSDRMVFTGDNVWHGELPAESTYGHFTFYITATNTEGNESRYPQNGNLTVYVSDMTPPSIDFENSTLPQFTLGKKTNLTVSAVDDNEVSYVVFYYRYEGDVEWRAEDMQSAVGSTYYLNFVPEHSGPMEFYFVAFDGVNRAYYPPSGAAAPVEVSVSSGGILGLSFTYSILMIIALVLLVVDIAVYYRKKKKGELPPLPGKYRGRKEKEEK